MAAIVYKVIPKMGQVHKLVLSVGFIVVGLWLVQSAITSLLDSRIGGAYFTTEGSCFFVPDLRGLFRSAYYLAKASLGVWLVWVSCRFLVSKLKH